MTTPKTNTGSPLSKECIDTLLGQITAPLARGTSSAKESKRLLDLAGNPDVVLYACQKGDGEVFCSWWMHEDLWNNYPKYGWNSIEYFTSEVPYRLMTTAGRGEGMFATKALAPGDLILAEHPIMLVPASFLSSCSQDMASEMEQAFKLLGKDRRNQFMALYDCSPLSYGNKLQSIFGTNCLCINFPHSKYLPDYAGVFPITSKLNYSCSSNTVQGFDPSTLILRLRATRPIAVGEEITNTYCGLILDYSSRQEQLPKIYKFNCNCEACKLPKKERKESNERRKKIRIAVMNQAFICKMWETLPTRQVIEVYKDILDAIERENLHVYMYEPVRWLTRAYAVLGDKKNLEIWAKEAMSACRRSSSFMGKNSFNDGKYWAELLKDVTKHPEWKAKRRV